MFRIIGSILLMAFIALSIMAAAPTNNGVINTTIASTVVDSQMTSSWMFVDSLIVQQTDSCYSVYSVSGTASMAPGNILYVGFLIGGGDPYAAPTDTFTLEWPAQRNTTKSLKFGFQIVDSLLSQTDDFDTVYVTAAAKGLTAQEAVTVTNFRIAGSVIDLN